MMYAEAEPSARRQDRAWRRSIRPSEAVDSLIANWERRVIFSDFLAEHWRHLRTINVIESPFGTVRLRGCATRSQAPGAGKQTDHDPPISII
jgi:transposase-like protein